MKVKELIEKLKELDQEALVVTGGYEGGYEHVEQISELEIKLSVNNEWYYGPHDNAADFKDVKKPKIKAYLL